MRPRVDVESRLKVLRKKPFHVGEDLGAISTLLWILEDWDWEVEKANLESRLKVIEGQYSKAPINMS